MTAVTIMLTALRQIFANLGQVLRIFLLPCLIATAIIFGGIWIIYEHRNIPGQAAFTLMLTALICGLWSAVNFHRHILLGERFGWLPRLHIRETMGYGIMPIPMGLVLVGSTWAITLVATELIFGPNLNLLGQMHVILRAVLFTLVTSTLIVALGLRLLSLLPGLAIGAVLRGYTRPRGSIATVLLIALILSGLRIGYSILLWAMMMTPIDPPTIIFVLQSTWVANVIIAIFAPIYFISLLTALYAQYVGKPAA